MFKKFTPKGIFATCFLFGLFAVCVWNFPIHNYDYENETYYYNYIFPPKYTQDYIDMETKYLLSRMAGKKDKDYLELLYSEIFALQSDAKSRLKYQQEYLSIDMEHNPDIVYSIITDYLILGKYNEACNIANNTKLAKDSCYKKSKTLGEVAYCRANIHYIKFIKDWYANEISCHITKSACYDTRVYQQYNQINCNYTYDFYKKRLEKTYNNHYEKIAGYKEILKNISVINDSSIVTTIFCIEDTSALG